MPGLPRMREGGSAFNEFHSHDGFYAFAVHYFSLPFFAEYIASFYERVV